MIYLVSLLLLIAAPVHLTPYDAVEIDIWHQPELSGKYFVDLDTTLNLPLVGTLPVKDIPIDSLQRLLVSRFQSYYGDIYLNVTCHYRINVFGEVKLPGNYYLKSNDNLAHLLAQAGGPTDNGDLGRIRIVNVGRERTVNFGRILKSGKNIDELSLEPGDVVIVPRRFMPALQEWSVLFSIGTFLLQVYLATQ